jgi:hypothetical protein
VSADWVQLPLAPIIPSAAAAAAGVMRIFAKEKSLPALVHCAHGKDRTGVVIMLLLLVCDVPHEAIVQDYVQVRSPGYCLLAAWGSRILLAGHTLGGLACRQLLLGMNCVLHAAGHDSASGGPTFNSCTACCSTCPCRV